MALTGFSETDYLAAGPVWPGQLPFVYSIWAWRENDSGADVSASLGQSGLNDHRRSLQFSLGTSYVARARSTAVADAVVAAPQTGVWAHWAGAFVATNSREVWVGGVKGTDITSITVGAPDETRIGLNHNNTFPWNSSGALASFSAWDAAGMTEQDRDALVASLAGGTNPLTLNLENEALVDYAELEDLNDLGPFSMQGSLSVFGSHPPISAPTKSSTGFRRRGVRVITASDPQFPLPVRKHRQIVADPKYRRHILYQDPDAPIRRWVQVVPGPLPARKQVSIEGL